MSNSIPSLDVIIPCYNASQTIQRAVDSVLNQSQVQHIFLVNDGSTDNTWHILQQLQHIYQAQFPNKIQLLNIPINHGVAAARNWGTLHSQADLVAFLDADDAYQAHALDPIPSIFYHLPALSLLRLKLIAVNLNQKFIQHPQFAQAWENVQMTVGGNMIFRRSLLLACGGFPQHDLFKKLGGEDAALGIALARSTMVGTLFAEPHAGVLHYCREGMHAERLLNAHLFQIHDQRISSHEFQQAENVTQSIIQCLEQLKPILNFTNVGRREILVEYQ